MDVGEIGYMTVKEKAGDELLEPWGEVTIGDVGGEHQNVCLFDCTVEQPTVPIFVGEDTLQIHGAFEAAYTP